MASAATPKRMVSSVFITLAAPHQATMTQQQSRLQAQSSPTRDKQHAAVRVEPSDRAANLIQRKEHPPPPESQNNANIRVRTEAGASVLLSEAQIPKSAKPGLANPSQQKETRDPRSTAEVLPPSSSDVRPPSLVFKESTTPFHSQTASSPPHKLSQQTVNNRVDKSTPSSGSSLEEQSQMVHENSQDTSRNSKDVCGFCRKPMAPSEPVIEALNRTYHEFCFQCRSCHVSLAGRQYYNKAGIPLCEDCYQASLELCWACGEVITDHVIRALERAYHFSCFTCSTCRQQIGEQAFAQGEVGEVYCLQDYYRKYAPQCSACEQLIIPKEDGTDSYTVECLGQSYHENCYRCETCGIQLCPEPNELGCYPLNGKLLCKSCHMNLVSAQH
ncbi:filamin-binding LIM protein 1 [Gouania willdenowi]|uniref:Filamin-binding LIM protein 1-like n=1 Tax=Gouania willdenowi TaxID=441366 RepID=A0A8C5DL30_GOUWI|nr:filamin-binding LIM protein 1-like [Gouania willdenowi]